MADEGSRPLARYASAESARHDAALQDAVHAEDYEAALAALKNLDKAESRAGIRPGEGTRLKIAGSARQMRQLKREQGRQIREMPGQREAQARKITAISGQVITERSSRTRATPEQARQVRESLGSAAAALRDGGYPAALAHLRTAREAAEGPDCTSVLTSGPDGRGAASRIDDLIREVRWLAGEHARLRPGR